MFSMLVKLLGGSLGPYVIGGAGAILALALGASAIQTARLDHAKAALAKARAALVDPKNGKTWQSEAEAAQQDLALCRSNERWLKSSLDGQNDAVAALERESEARTAASAKALSAARKSAQTAQARVAAILAARPASADACACASADALILKEAGA